MFPWNTSYKTGNITSKSIILKSLVDNTSTDKDTLHSYLDVYEYLFASIRDTATNILEIGVCEGGSIDLWSKYFTKATIYGADIDLSRNKHTFTDSRIRLLKENAYTDNFVNKFQTGTFDVIIDDGPHTLQSMIQVAVLFPKLLKHGGLFIIEDIQDMKWISTIIRHLPKNLQKTAIVYNRISVKGRYDDIQLVCRNV